MMNKYPMYADIHNADEAQLEYWFLNLPAYDNAIDAEKWGMISSRYYLGDDDDIDS